MSKPPDSIQTDAGDSVTRRALLLAATPASSLHYALGRGLSQGFVSRAYLAEKAQRVVDNLRAMGVDIR